VLSVLFRVFPGGEITVARTATAVATGLVPLLPWLLWRGVVRRRIRLLAGAMLALWPGGIFFSGAIAQDNWVLLPAIALASLAVRRLCDPLDDGHPVASGLLLGFAIAIRQEMALVLLPAALAAGASRRSWRRKAPALAMVFVAFLLLLAAQRLAATGRFQ